VSSVPRSHLGRDHESVSLKVQSERSREREVAAVLGSEAEVVAAELRGARGAVNEDNQRDQERGPVLAAAFFILLHIYSQDDL
jgi:hypothetical protein